MTAFNSIKTNNWPSASNDLEDFLVLELPLNNQAALTSSRRDIVAGSTVLYPKRTLANSGVSMQAFDPNAGTTINIAASEYSTSGTVSNAGNLFDGDTSTTVSSADTARIFWTPASNISVTKFEVYFSSQYSGYKIGIEVTGGSSQIITKSNPGNSPGWVEFTSIAGDTIGPSNQIKFRSYRSNDTDPGILGINAVRVNDKIVTTAPAGTPKKHYDKNASFNASVLTTSAPVPRGGAPRTLEFWAFLNSGANSWQNIVAYGSSGDSQCFGINRGNSDTSNIAFTGFSGGDWATGTSVASYLDTWTHFSVSYDSGTVEIFLNGTSIGTASRTLNTGGSTFVVGGSEHSGNNERFSGNIQDLRVYNKKIRTANFTPPGAILG